MTPTRELATQVAESFKSYSSESVILRRLQYMEVPTIEIKFLH